MATPLLPEPILTHWGTWLSAAIYCAEHLKDNKNVFGDLDETEASCIAKAKYHSSVPLLLLPLHNIKTHFCFLPEAILRLESATLSLKDALDIINNVSRKEIPGPVGAACSSKVKNILM